MRTLIIVTNGLVAGAGTWAFLNAETWASSVFIFVVAVSIIVYGEFLRRIHI